MAIESIIAGLNTHLSFFQFGQGLWLQAGLGENTTLLTVPYVVQEPLSSMKKQSLKEGYSHFAKCALSTSVLPPFPGLDLMFCVNMSALSNQIP